MISNNESAAIITQNGATTLSMNHPQSMYIQNMIIDLNNKMTNFVKWWCMSLADNTAVSDPRATRYDDTHEYSLSFSEYELRQMYLLTETLRLVFSEIRGISYENPGVTADDVTYVEGIYANGVIPTDAEPDETTGYRIVSDTEAKMLKHIGKHTFVVAMCICGFHKEHYVAEIAMPDGKRVMKSQYRFYAKRRQYSRMQCIDDLLF
jgi:hypothetical protein